MIIRTYQSDYVVIRRGASGSMKDIYICRKAQEKNSKEYTIVRVRDLDMCQRLISFFTQEVDEEKFTDFVECFTLEGRLNFVFLHSARPTLTEKLNTQNCSFSERLEIAHKLLERIVYLNMPPALLADALELDHITVSDSLEVRFNYELSYLNRLTDYSIREVGLDIDDVFRRIFAPELERMSCPEISRYLEWLEKDEYQSYLDIFYRFNRCYAVLKKKTDSELAVPGTPGFRFWERVRGFLGFLKRLLMLALLAGAVIYLAISIIDAVTPKSSGMAVEAVDRFDYIGTVDIEDDAVTIEESWSE